MEKKYFLLILILGLLINNPMTVTADIGGVGVNNDVMMNIAYVSNSSAGLPQDLSYMIDNVIRNEEALQEMKEAEKQKAELAQKIYEEEMGPFRIYDSPGGAFKSFMPWQAITDRSTMQWKLQQWASVTNWETGLREINGRICVAIGSYYNAPIGSYIDLIMKNGSVIKCIMADQKADKDTDPTHRWHSIDGSVGEFLVETRALPKIILESGDISYISPRFEGEISQIKVYEKIYSFTE